MKLIEVRRLVNKRLSSGKFNAIPIAEELINKIIDRHGGLTKNNKEFDSGYYLERGKEGLIVFQIKSRRLTLYVIRNTK